MTAASATLDGVPSAPASDEPPPPRGSNAKAHRLDIQGLRAVAVLMVVAFHAGLPVPGGFVGVDVFFVISGFVITAMLVREHEKIGRIRLWRFYVRRFKRLTPALAVTVGFVMLASLVLLSPLGGQQAAAKTGIGAMFLAANIVIARTTGGYFDGPAEFNPLLNMWSLSVEEQFYLVFPAVMVIGWLIAKPTGRSRMALAATVGAMGVVSFALSMVVAADIAIPLIPDSLIGFYSPATRAWEFAVGALLALGGNRLAAATPRTALILGATGSVMVASSLWLIGAQTTFPGPWTLLPVTGILLLLASGTADSPIRRLLESPTMVAIGDRSYSIYLWHWPFIVFAHLIWSPSPWVLTAAALASLAPAFASYRWIEQPMRALPTERGRPLLRLVAIVVVPPVALASILLVAAQNNMWNPTLQRYADAINPIRAGIVAGCNDGAAWQDAESCTWNGEAAGSPIYLVGDSNADHFSDGLIDASLELSRPLVNLTASGCTYLPSLPTVDADTRKARCATYTRGTQGYLAHAERGTVVLSNAYWLYLFTDAAALTFDESPHPLKPSEKLSALGSALTATVRELESAGHNVILVQTIPHWGGSDSLTWASCSLLTAPSDGCAQTMPLSDSVSRQGSVAEIVAHVASDTGAGLLDLSDQICPNSLCSNISPEGLATYRDGTHITVIQSRELAPTFARALARTGT